MQGKALQDFVIDKIDDLKGQDIIALDVGQIQHHRLHDHLHRHLDSPRDVDRQPRGAGIPCRRHGAVRHERPEASDWIVVDLGEVIVHVMQEESRRLYELEKLWS